MSTTYHNLSELLNGEGLGDGSPGAFGRSIYKYTDCGPWVSFLVPGAWLGRVYYTERAAYGWGPRLWGARCTGISVGSIVEGSDAEVGPVRLYFPFTNEQLWDAVQEINDEACAFWDEANVES